MQQCFEKKNKRIKVFWLVGCFYYLVQICTVTMVIPLQQVLEMGTPEQYQHSELMEVNGFCFFTSVFQFWPQVDINLYIQSVVVVIYV